MSSTLIATVSVGCFLVTSLVLADLRRDFPKFPFNKAARSGLRRGSHGNQGNKGSNFGANRVYYPFSGKQSSPKVVDPYNNQPGYVGSKTVYNDNAQGNNPYGNKGGNVGAQGVTNPYNGNQGSPKVVDAYKNPVGNVVSKPGSDAYANQQGIDPYLVQGTKGGDVYKVGDPYTVNQGRLTAPDPYKSQPGYNGNDPKVKNSQELGQYSNQDNKGGNVGPYTVTSVYGGNQGGSQRIDPYNNQPGNIGGTINKDTYNNEPGNIGGTNNKDTYNNPTGNIGGTINKDTYNNPTGNIGGTNNKDTYNNQPGNIGGTINKDTYNNQPGNIDGTINKDLYNNPTGNIGGTNNKDPYNNNNNNLLGGTTVYNNAL